MNEMIITKIEKVNNNRSLIFIDEELEFSLYNTEIRRMRLIENESIDEITYNFIINDILLKRCRERIGYILGKSDKSEDEIRKKLKQGYYPNVIIERVIKEYKGYGYIDDVRYAFNYIMNNIKRKSIKKIQNELYLKGISKEIYTKVFEKYEYENMSTENFQESIIEREFYRKKYDFIEEDRIKLNKIITSLLRKGFEYENIMSVYNRLKNMNKKDVKIY